MRLMLLYNPIAGAGRTADAASALREVLHAAGHEPSLVQTRLDPQKQWLDPQMAEVDILVVLGGDGAVRLACGAAGRTGTPLYHYPLGTENLFAREFGYRRSQEQLLRALERGEVRRLDLGIANNRNFLLMASMGFDAEVTYDLSRRRGDSISHLTYVPLILRRLAGWRPPTITIRVDGETIVDRVGGCVVVGNSRQYAMRIDPALRASMTDGQLDVVFFPTRGRLALVRWAAACRLRRQLGRTELIYRLGREVEVSSDQPVRYQLDGDAPEPHATDPEDAAVEEGASNLVRISLRPGNLPILIP
jgi:diacylglycerol kinase family enzyme